MRDAATHIAVLGGEKWYEDGAEGAGAGGASVSPAQSIFKPLKTVQVKLTPVEDRAPVKVYLLRPRGTLYWGGAGLDGPYVQSQIEAFRKTGIAHCFAGLTNSGSVAYGHAGTLIDAIRSGLVVRYRDAGEWTITSGMAAEAPQFNLIGYSYGSLLAAQTAWSYARNGHIVDNLVLVASPIDGAFLADLRGHRNIRNVLILDLRLYGDPIYAGMGQAELIAAAPLLAKQMLAGKGEGHFHYAHVVRDSPDRWASLAQTIAAQGVR